MKSEAVADPVCHEPLSACSLGGPVSRSLSRTARLHRMAAAKALKVLGLYPGQESLMIHLWKSGPQRQSDLIKTLELDPSTVTKMLQRLEQTGHVRRSADPADRRAVLVEATTESCELNAAAEAALAELEGRTLAGLDEGERVELVRLLGKVEENLCTQTTDCAAQGG
ncbi:MarR family winged helix-turn-helix transcriptional regulator [Streptomyces albipurpureus]|uniref:MarR family winged helix-turn-helix transcriptional regulator n=1 Tax=Streptomyces albipurpureus TaxID=2897419 RepID=A0ABT0USC4_9ACTN|nr:MarR family winged helix-turn-helix transcriptional regulator [Streptomyces sp. CWNU-1]MCM2391513.1 MarR family winged helix-turn-helix transcriptional regulator [Streptomyces sp. CWNU-1]